MDPFTSSLQVPDPSAGPSRNTRPSSVQPTTSTSPSSSSRKRASHSVVTGHQQEEQPQYRDVYSHPAALEYAAAHPRRSIPKFGPYLLLRTLGEGEFGKVKLGLHMQWGEEVAVKLIRRGNIDTTVRMGKVEREIEVLRSLKHPNIVRLYDVIETDKYIGIILEFAQGGELFDHILAHRYLREKDACKLFCQLISGVWYIHQKKIVHRDLKLENLLLDRNRNVIITDFGFANRFEHRSDDLMQTSCGSPCYAAPELVISDGSYVGSAVDIWSCGVILYAMLAGYLPFDDDPANPDGDNINLLYKYIVNTPLSFPDYISADARDLLSIMLVPDPEQRANLRSIMSHRWLTPYASIFNRSVEELERSAMEQHRLKRLQYQKQMKQSTADPATNQIARAQSAAVNGASSPHSPRHRAQPEYLYETSGDQSMYSTTSPTSARRAVNSAIVLPTSPPLSLEDDPFAPSPSHDVPSIALGSPLTGQGSGVQEEARARKESRTSERKASGAPPVVPVKSSPDSKRQKSGFRHTIQVEVPESQDQQQQQYRPVETTPRRTPSVRTPESQGPVTPTAERRASKKPISDGGVLDGKPLPVTPAATPLKDGTNLRGQEPEPVVAIEVTSPPQIHEEKAAHAQVGTTSSAGSGGSTRGHKRGISMDKMGLGKIFGSGGEAQTQTNGASSISRTPSQKSTPVAKPSIDTIMATKADGKGSATSRTLSLAPTSSSSVDPTLLSPDNASSVKKSRRNTLTVMVEPFRSKQRTKGKTTTSAVERTPVSAEKEKALETSVPPATPKPSVPKKDLMPPSTPSFAPVSSVPASTMKASKVMQWFRSKSKGKTPADIDDPEKQQMYAEPSAAGLPANAASSTSTISHAPGPTPTAEKAARSPVSGHPTRSASGNVESFMEKGFVSRLGRVSGSTTAAAKGTIRVHHGAVDQTTITTAPPPDVMKHVKKVLEDMGIDVEVEGDYKYRCVRPKRKKTGAGAGLGLRDAGSGLAAFTISGSAASNGVDKRGLPAPSQSHASFGSSTGGMLRGLLMRRQSSQVSTYASPDAENASEAALVAAAPVADVPAIVTGEAVYGHTTQDQGDEVRFSVELTRMDRLDDTYSLDIRRLKGNLRSYKFLYDTLRERADLQR